MTAEAPERLQPAGLLQHAQRRLEGREQPLGRHRIEHGADVVVGRDARDPEQRLAVRPPLALLETPLVRQE
jgi:hypothetical protein